MKRTYPPVTWDQATILQLATIDALADLLGYGVSTLRRWAKEGRIHAVATAPGGKHLYHAPTVQSAAAWRPRTDLPA